MHKTSRRNNRGMLGGVEKSRTTLRDFYCLIPKSASNFLLSYFSDPAVYALKFLAIAGYYASLGLKQLVIKGCSS